MSLARDSELNVHEEGFNLFTLFGCFPSYVIILSVMGGILRTKRISENSSKQSTVWKKKLRGKVLIYIQPWLAWSLISRPAWSQIHKDRSATEKNRGHTEAYVYERKQQTVLFKGKKEGLLPLTWLFESVFTFLFSLLLMTLLHQVIFCICNEIYPLKDGKCRFKSRCSAERTVTPGSTCWAECHLSNWAQLLWRAWHWLGSQGAVGIFLVFLLGSRKKVRLRNVKARAREMVQQLRMLAALSEGPLQAAHSCL